MSNLDTSKPKPLSKFTEVKTLWTIEDIRENLQTYDAAK